LRLDHVDAFELVQLHKGDQKSINGEFDDQHKEYDVVL
jgi:hypothetical protein